MQVTIEGEPTVTTVMTMTEAKLLKEILGNVSGDPNSSRRAITDKMFDDLDDAGVENLDLDPHAAQINIHFSQ